MLFKDVSLMIHFNLVMPILFYMIGQGNFNGLHKYGT